MTQTKDIIYRLTALDAGVASHENLAAHTHRFTDTDLIRYVYNMW